jgi:uncharacterized membrane protein YeaQ/YmgE (transglycosylase-associated protein family)
MLVTAWILVGFLAGTIARNILVKSNERFMTDVVLGIVGALGAGWVSNGFAITLTAFNLHSVLGAFIGAGLLIFIVRRARRGRYRGRGAWGART